MKDRVQNIETFSTLELAQKTQSIFVEMSKKYPGSDVFPAARTSIQLRGLQYTPTDFLNAFLSDPTRSERLADSINLMHEGRMGQHNAIIPHVSPEAVEKAVTAVFNLAERMMNVSPRRLKRLIGLHNPRERVKSEALAESKIKAWGI